MAAPPISADELRKIIGPPLIAALLNTGLFGVLSVQVYLYYLTFSKRDTVYRKLLVYGIYLLETTQTVLIIQTAFHMYVVSFGNLLSFDEDQTAWLSVPIMTAIGTFFAQMFYAHRISMLSKSYLVATVILLLSVAQLGAGIATGVYVKEVRFFSHVFTTKIHLATGIWNGGSALCDTIIAVSMTYYLSRYDGRARQTHLLLKRIIHLTVETGTITAILAIASFLLTMLPGNPAYYQAVMGTVGKVYANSMLVLINSRIHLGVEAEKNVVTSFLSTVRFQPQAIDLELSGGSVSRVTDSTLVDHEKRIP